MEKLRMNVQGRVQGVGFRYMTKMVADQLGVTGSVRNEDDGSVSITAIAPEDIMESSSCFLLIFVRASFRF